MLPLMFGTWTNIETLANIMFASRLQDGASPLLIASQNGHLSIAKLLLGCGANPNLQTEVSGRIFYTYKTVKVIFIERNCV